MHWLIREDIAEQLTEARRAQQPTAQDLREMRADMGLERRDGDHPECLALAGDVAEIRVDGVLTEQPDFWAWLLGIPNTTYGDLLEAIAVAKASPAVRRVVVRVDSAGGECSGLFDVLDAFADLRASKAVTVEAIEAHSAAYGIAAVAGPIEACGRASMFGSVGVAVSFLLRDNVLDLTNSASPDKRPDLRTDEGKAVVVAQLDAIYDLFADAIATGRGTTVQRVAADFGRGASFTAEEARRRGMIDSIAGQEPTHSPPAAPAASTHATPTVRVATSRPSARATATETLAMTTTANTDPALMDDEEHEDELPPEEEEERDPEAMDEDEEQEDASEAQDDAEEEAKDDGDEKDEPFDDDGEKKDDEEDEKDKPKASRSASKSQPSSVLARLTARARELTGNPKATVGDALDALASMKTEAWLSEECGRRSLSLSPEQRATCLRLAAKGEREGALAILDAINAPPSAPPQLAAVGPVPETFEAAVEACMEDARALAQADEQKAAAKQRRPALEVPRHHVVAYAQKLAAERYPEHAAG